MKNKMLASLHSSFDDIEERVSYTSYDVGS